MELIVTAETARSLLKIRKDELYKMLESGELPAFRVGNAWKIPGKLLEQYVEERAMRETLERRSRDEKGRTD